MGWTFYLLTLGIPTVVMLSIDIILARMIYRLFHHVSTRQEKKDARKYARCKLSTIAFIKRSKYTGTTINDDPEYLIEAAAVDEEGRLFPIVLKGIVPLEDIDCLRLNNILAIRYNPDDPNECVLDQNPDDFIIQERLDRYNSYRHPDSTPYYQKREVELEGVDLPAKITSLSLTGKEEAGEIEISITVLITDDIKGDKALSTKLFISEESLPLLAVGAYIMIRAVLNKDHLFALKLPVNHNGTEEGENYKSSMLIGF